MATTGKGFVLFEQSLINPDIQLNEMLLGLESMLFANPIDKDLTTPPGSESDFDLYIVGGDATAIASFTASTNTITFESTVDTVYTEGKKFTVKSASDSDNNGHFTVVSSSGADVVVGEDIDDEGSSPAIGYFANGDWNGHVDDLAIYYNEQYYFKTPLEGWGPVYLQDEDIYYVYDGTNWGTTSSFSGAASNQIRDTDNDTKIQLEESANENIIRFDVAGTEVVYIDNSAIRFNNNYAIQWKEGIVGTATDIIKLDANNDLTINVPNNGSAEELKLSFAGVVKDVFTDSGYLTIGSTAPSGYHLGLVGSDPILLLDGSSGAGTTGIFADSNRTGAGENILQFNGYWNGANIAGIHFNTGSDTVNKDDGRIHLQTSIAGGIIEDRIIIKETGMINFVPLTSAEIAAATPAKGDIAVNDTINKLQWYNGTAWRTIADGTLG